MTLNENNVPTGGVTMWQLAKCNLFILLTISNTNSGKKPGNDRERSIEV